MLSDELRVRLLRRGLEWLGKAHLEKLKAHIVEEQPVLLNGDIIDNTTGRG